MLRGPSRKPHRQHSIIVIASSQGARKCLSLWLFPHPWKKLQSVLGRMKKTQIEFQDSGGGRMIRPVFRLAASENSESNHASASSRVKNSWTTPGDANFNVSSTHIWTGRLAD